jgi:hypothetical protein
MEPNHRIIRADKAKFIILAFNLRQFFSSFKANPYWVWLASERSASTLRQLNIRNFFLAEEPGTANHQAVFDAAGPGDVDRRGGFARGQIASVV